MLRTTLLTRRASQAARGARVRRGPRGTRRCVGHWPRRAQLNSAAPSACTGVFRVPRRRRRLGVDGRGAFRGAAARVRAPSRRAARAPHRRRVQPACADPGARQHTNTEDNNDRQHFDFTPENMKRVKVILDKYPTNYKQSACIPLLDLAQRQSNNFLSLAAMEKIAKILEMDPLHVAEVATFYTMFNRKPVGKYFIQLCGTTPCMVCGSEEIKKTIEDFAGVKNGGARPLRRRLPPPRHPGPAPAQRPPRTASSPFLRSSASAPASTPR